MRAIPPLRLNRLRDFGRVLFAWARWIFTPLAVGFIAYFAWRSRELLASVVSHALPGYLVLAVAVWGVLHLNAPLFNLVVLKGCGSIITYRRVLFIYASRLPARYIPGGVWHTVTRFIDLQRDAVEPAHLTVFFVLENALAASLAFLMGGTVVFAFRGWNGWGAVGALGALVGAASLAVLPVIVNRGLLRNRPPLRARTYLLAILLVAITWTVAPTAFFLYLSAFPLSLGDASYLEIAGTYLLSWGIGFVSPFAPQGIGVFEAVAGSMLRGPVALGGLAVLVAGFRGVILAADLLVWGTTYLSRALR